MPKTLSEMNEVERKRHWGALAAEHLVGKTIKEVRYLTEAETQVSGFSRSPLLIIFTDGTDMFPSSDDEGNDGGALFTSFDGLETIPVI